MDMPSLTHILDVFARVFDIGRKDLGVDVKLLFHALIMIEVILAGLYVALGSDGSLGVIAKKVLQIGFIHWVIKYYDWVLKVVLQGFIDAGKKAGSQPDLNMEILKNPDLIFLKGLEIVGPALERVRASTKESYFGIPDCDSIIIMVCTLIAVFAFTIMAIQVFVTYLEYLIVSTIGFILVPFAIFKPTEYLTKQLFGAIVGFGIKLMALAVIIAVSLTIMGEMQTKNDISWGSAINMVMVALALCFISWHAPSLILSLFSGKPSLTSGHVNAFAGMTKQKVVSGAKNGLSIAGGTGALAMSSGAAAITAASAVSAKVRSAVSSGAEPPKPASGAGA